MSTKKAVVETGMNSKLASENADTFKILCFRLGGEEFAIDVAHIDEIVRHQEIRMTKDAADFAHGSIDLRGKTIPVMDLRKCFDMKLRSTKESYQFVVVNMADQKVGLIVDSVTGVQKSKRAAIQPVADVALPPGCDCISGIIGEDEQYMLMVDLQNLFEGHLQFSTSGHRRE
jgi:purine-binding chemotaxis protein CheW